jgi:uncharacterized protein with NRDE domain
MCLAAWSWGQSERFPLVVAANRDEFDHRAAAPLNWWPAEPGQPGLLAGRDLQAGGTWMGLNTAGRFALLTNVRQPGPVPAGAPSRGDLVPAWLRSEGPPAPFVQQHLGLTHAPYNLLAADWPRGVCFWASNAALPGASEVSAQRLEPGLYGLSNAQLDTPWPKVTALKDRLAAAMAWAETTPHASPVTLAEQLFDSLADPTRAPDAALPQTGVTLEIERMLSAAFIRSPSNGYGTRCSTVLVVEQQAPGQYQAWVAERTHDPASPRARTGVDNMPSFNLPWPPAFGAQAPG